ncbi:MAG: inosine/xanthosine triphosphatase [Deinococcales bacterium]
MRTPSRVALGSANPAKRTGVQTALAAAFPATAPALSWHDVPSGVPDQPWGDEVTLRGARSRAAGALRLADGDDAIGIGIEGGVTREGGRVWSFSWAVALAPGGASGAARSAAFVLPHRVTRLLEDGLELGDAVDRVFAVEGSKHAGGAVGLLTRGALERPALYAHAVLLALMPLLRSELYVGDTGNAGG